MHRTVIIQSNYIPWKGYFDLLNSADSVVMFDSVQSTKNDWRNRNQIKTASGKQWLTIPIKHSSTIRVRDVEIASGNWQEKHLRTLRQSYARAPHAQSVMPLLEGWYEEATRATRLSQVNRIFIRAVADFLGISTQFVEVESLLDDDVSDALEPTARLVDICKRLNTTTYISGPAARAYLDTNAFQENSIHVEWFNYDHYPPYPQLHGDFEHGVSILDLLLMTGPDAQRYALRNQFESTSGALSNEQRSDLSPR